MSMAGFLWGGHTECILLLFRSLPLDSPIRFYLGIAATVVLGVLVELLSCVRRRLQRARLFARRWPHTWRLGTLTLFAAQTALAYGLMLIAMTYEGELFVAVILGLAIGHGAFNLNAPIGASADPCCTSEDAEKFSHRDPLIAPLAASDAATSINGGASPTRLLLSVTGMSCASCVDTVRHALTGIEGVAAVRVEASGEVEVLCRPGLSALVCIEAVRKVPGMDAVAR